MPKRIIIDTDPAMGTKGGDPEDCFAIMLALNSPELQIEGITTVQGNVPVERGFSNVTYLLNELKKDIPIHSGIPGTFDEDRSKERSWLGQRENMEQITPLLTIDKEKIDAPSFISSTCNDNPNEIELVTIGPLTNVAKALEQTPDLKKNIKKNFFEDEYLINRVLLIIEKFLKIHIKNQIENGANVIQIFDSWAGLLEERDYPNYIYTPTLNLVDYVKSLGVPVICFPREIKNYKEFCEIVKPDAVNIDYNVDPLMISKNIKIPVQGGLDPKILLTDQENLKKEILKYLDIFKDHPYIFNLGHGILPETDPAMVEHLINTVRDY